MSYQSQPRPLRRLLWVDGARPVEIEVEIVATDPLIQRGLMHRRTLPPNGGMLFVFDRPERRTFWMRNTPLRLDMIFIGPNGRVVGVVENAEPWTDDRRGVLAASQYVLEVNGGFAATHGIVRGARVRILNEAPRR